MARKPTSRRPRKSDVKAAAARAEARSKGTPIEEPKVEIDPTIIMAEEIKRLGRPTLYKPEYVAIAKEMCRRGATDHDLAEEFGVATSTIWRWTVKHEDFCSAIKSEKDGFDDRVERALAQRAIGYTYNSEKVFSHNGEIVRAEIIEHLPPDVGAAKMWLTNRRRATWSEVVRNEITGKIAVTDESDKMALARWIAFHLTTSPASDGEAVH